MKQQNSVVRAISQFALALKDASKTPEDAAFADHFLTHAQEVAERPTSFGLPAAEPSTKDDEE
jgi:flagellar hook-associated protein FlgK